MNTPIKLNKNEIKWITGYMQANIRGNNYCAEPPTENVVDYIKSNKLDKISFNEYIVEVLLNIHNTLVDSDISINNTIKVDNSAGDDPYIFDCPWCGVKKECLCIDNHGVELSDGRYHRARLMKDCLGID